MLDRPVLSSGIIVLGMVAVTLAFLAGKAAWYVQYKEPPGEYSPVGPKYGFGNVFASVMHTEKEEIHAEAIEAASKQALKYLAGSLFTALVATGTLWFATSSKEGTANRNSNWSLLILGLSVFFAVAAICSCFAYHHWSVLSDARDDASYVRQKWGDSDPWSMRIPKERSGWLLELVCRNEGRTYQSRAVSVVGGDSLSLFVIRNPAHRSIEYGWYQSYYSSEYDSEYPYGPKWLKGKLTEVASGKIEDPFPVGGAIAERESGAISDGDVLLQYRDGETGYIPTLQSTYEIRVTLQPPTVSAESDERKR